MPPGPLRVTYFGLTVPYRYMMQPALWRTNYTSLNLPPKLRPHFGTGPAASLPCADGNDIVTSPIIVGAQYQANSSRGEEPAGDCTLFFAGPPVKGGSSCPHACEVLPPCGTLPSAPRPRCSNVSGFPDIPCGPGPTPLLNTSHCYSQGVRGEVFAHHEGRAGFCLHRSLPRAEVRERMRRSRFCLAPSGEGFGCRLPELMIRGGCVPVIIQPAVIQPHEAVLPYDEFALRFEFAGAASHLQAWATSTPHCLSRIARPPPQTFRSCTRCWRGSPTRGTPR